MFAFRRFQVIAVVLALALVAAACGGGDDTSADTTTTTASSSGGGSEGAADTTTTSQAEPVSGDSGSTYCERIRDAEEDDGSSPIDFDFFNKTPEEIEAQMKKNLEVFEDWVSIAPSEIEDDANVVLAAYRRFIELGNQLEWDLLAMSDNEEFNTVFDNAELNAAGDNLDAYSRDVCGVDFTETVDPGPASPPATAGGGDDAVSILLGTFGIPAGLLSEDDVECLRGELGEEFEAKITPEYELTDQDTALLFAAIGACNIGLG